MSLIALLFVGAAPAAAVTWREWPRGSADVIVSKEDDGDVQVKGYGDWTVLDTEDGTRSRGRGYVIDKQPGDDNPVYFNMMTYTSAGTCVAGPDASCEADYFAWEDDQMGDKARWPYDEWSDRYRAGTDVNPKGTSARGGFKVCEDQGFWNPDDCTSSWSLTWGVKY